MVIQVIVVIQGIQVIQGILDILVLEGKPDTQDVQVLQDV